jgi:hypothetical protein
MLFCTALGPLLYLLIRRNRKSLHHPRNLALYGIIYDMYKPEFMFITPLEMFRLYFDAVVIFVFVKFPIVQLSLVSIPAICQLVFHSIKNAFEGVFVFLHFLFPDDCHLSV